jgi:quinol monooxygenase YgiN
MTYALAVKLTADEGDEEAVQAALLRVCELSRAEAGCLAFRPHRAVDDPRVFFVYEHFVDRAAHTAHTQTDHFREIVEVEIMPRTTFEMLELEPL